MKFKQLPPKQFTLSNMKLRFRTFLTFIKIFTQSTAIRNNSIPGIVVMVLIIYTFIVIIATNLNLNAQSSGMSFNCEPCEFYDSYSQSCYPKQFANPPGISGNDTGAEECDYDYEAYPQGGTEPYTFSWTGVVNGSSNPVTLTNAQKGIHMVNVEIADADGCTIHDSKNVEIKPKVEGNEEEAETKQVGDSNIVVSHECTPEGMSGTLTGEATLTGTAGGSISGGGDIELVRVELEINASLSLSVSGADSINYNCNSTEQTIYLMAKLMIRKTKGTYKYWYCDGSYASGDWANVTESDAYLEFYLD